MIAYLTTKQLAEYLIKNNKNPDEYTYVLISDDIMSEGKCDVNVRPELIPTGSVMSININDGCTDSYVNAYLKQLSNEEQMSTIIMIVKAVLEGDKVIIVTSKRERLMHYPNILCDEVFENMFNIKVLTHKDLKKNPNLLDESMPEENVRASLLKMFKILKNYSEMGISFEQVLQPQKYYAMLKEQKKKKLIKYCDAAGINVDATFNKEDIIDEIMSRSILI